MSRLLSDLDALLRQLITEHQKLGGHVERHQCAMKAFDLKLMDEAANAQEASRLRIATIENRRRMVVGQLARLHRVTGNMTIQQIADLYPAQSAVLIGLRNELKGTMASLAGQTHVAGRLAGAVLGHLNTVVRLLAGAVENAGVYTRSGIPQVSARIGVMEAVG